MKIVGEVCQFLDNLFPVGLSEPWDNTGMLVGDRSLPVRNVMTCLTIAPGTVREALERDVNLIIVHHPLPFRPVSQITTDSISGQMLWQLIGNRIAVYSPHTRFDSAAGGINELICGRLGLNSARPIVPAADGHDQLLGAGRIGRLDEPLSWDGWIARIKSAFGLRVVRAVVAPGQNVQCVAVACGSGGSLMAKAIDQGCDTFVTGEINFHACLECQSRSVALTLLGHYQSERFAMEVLAHKLQAGFNDLAVWESSRESDPISTY